MANSLDLMVPELWKPDLQDWLNARLVAEKICNMKWSDMLRSGDVIHWNSIADFRVQSYTPGTDLTIDALTAADSSLTINRSKAATAYIDPQETKQVEAKEYVGRASKQASFALARELDQHVLSTGIAGVATGNTVSGGTLTITSSNVFDKVAEARGILSENNAVDGEMFMVCNPTITAKISQAGVVNGFKLSDDVQMKGISQFFGEYDGFKIYESNDLPTSVTLTIATIPVAAETITVHGVVLTAAASGAATAAGEFSIGANAAAAVVNIVLALNGTGTPGATTYRDFSAENRRKLQAAGLVATATSATVTTIASTGAIRGAETLTAAADVFGTETTSVLFGRVGAISCARQMGPDVYFKEEPKQLGHNMIAHQLYGDAVFSRDAFRLAKMTVVNTY